jgi:hypothetical protein
MLYNLSAEMARHGIKNSELASLIDKSEQAVKKKIKGENEFLVGEATLIRDTYFPEMRIEYLFHNDAARHDSDPQAKEAI